MNEIEPTVASLLQQGRDLLAAFTAGLTAYEKKNRSSALSSVPFELGKRGPEILRSPATLDAVMDFVRDCESATGPGTQQLNASMVRKLQWMASLIADPSLAFRDGEDPAPDAAAKLADYAFAKLQGGKVSSEKEAQRRFEMWEMREYLLDPLPADAAWLDHATKVVQDKKASGHEREGALNFLIAHWRGLDEVDPTVNDLLNRLQKIAPSRSFLFSVVDVQDELGFTSDHDPPVDLDGWDEGF